jgi:serine/threonine protein kinase
MMESERPDVPDRKPPSVKCPTCGTIYLFGTEVCTRDGTPLTVDERPLRPRITAKHAIAPAPEKPSAARTASTFRDARTMAAGDRTPSPGMPMTGPAPAIPATGTAPRIVTETGPKIRTGTSPKIRPAGSAPRLRPEAAPSIPMTGPSPSLQAVERGGKAPPPEAVAPRVGPPRAEDFVGKTFGIYTLMTVLHEGESGWVFEGNHEAADQRVAIKLLYPHLARRRKQVARYFNELRAVDKLAHPNIAAIIELGETEKDAHGEGPFSYVVTEYLDGENLEELLVRAGRLTSRRAVNLTLMIGSAVLAAHRVGVVHRWLHAGHVLLGTKSNGDDWLKLIDFGSCCLDEEIDEGPAGKGDKTALFGPSRGPEGIGRSVYRAPEVRAGKPSDARADVFSIGVLLYQMLTGRVPFKAQAGANTSYREPTPISSMTGDILPALNDIVMTCLARKPEDRYPDVAALRVALKQALNIEPSIALEAPPTDLVVSPPPAAVARPHSRVATIMITAAATLMATVAAVWLVERFATPKDGTEGGGHGNVQVERVKARAGSPEAPLPATPDKKEGEEGAVAQPIEETKPEGVVAEPKQEAVPAADAGTPPKPEEPAKDEPPLPPGPPKAGVRTELGERNERVKLAPRPKKKKVGEGEGDEGAAARPEPKKAEPKKAEPKKAEAGKTKVGAKATKQKKIDPDAVKDPFGD